MKYIELKDAVMNEINTCLNQTSEKEINTAIKTISRAKKIFVFGAGRTGLVASEFAMRLMHIGFNVYKVGEVTTPAIEKKDLLVVCSGSGETTSALNLVNVANKVGASTLLFTTKETSTIASLVNNKVVIHAKAAKSDDGSVKSIQPLSNLFAQSLILTFDMIIIMLMNKLNIDETKLKNKHANLE